MNPRITSIENLIASDPGGRNIFGLVITDQLRLAAQSLRLARRVGIVSGFYIPQANAGETDGPPGAKALGDALHALGIEVDYITDHWCAPLFRALDIEPMIEPRDYVTRANPTHLVSVERPGRGRDGRYRNMRGIDISATTFPLDDLFLEATRKGLTTIGVGDGGNEIGMGKVFAEALSTIDHGPDIASTVATDFCIAAGVSNWGAYGLAGALSVLSGRDLLPTADGCMKDIDRVVRIGGAVDGVTHRREPTVDGLDLSVSIRMLENIRRQIIPSPLERGESLLVGVLGYGETGRSASALLTKQGHRVRISDVGSITLERGLVVDGVETGGHTIDFLQGCDLVVASPGVREDSPIRDELHRRAIPVMSELELAFQLAPRDLIAVTGTIGKRTTVELLRS
ncbi:MAG: glutamate cyclase domain-containing protein, partial [Planctomycetota bacterium]